MTDSINWVDLGIRFVIFYTYAKCSFKLLDDVVGEITSFIITGMVLVGTIMYFK